MASRLPSGRLLHMVVVCDRSNSTLGVACDSENLLSAFDLWIAEGFTATGGSFAVYQVGSSRDTARLLYTVSVPDRTVAERVAFLIAARAELDHLLSEGAEKNTSAVAETISVAISQVRERLGRYQLLLLSDLRQFTPRKWNTVITVGESSIVTHLSEATARLYDSDWTLADPKDNRAAKLATLVRQRFSTVHPRPLRLSAMSALAYSGADDTLVIAIDNLGDTAETLKARRDRQRATFQIVGRGLGGSSGARMALQGTLLPATVTRKEEHALAQDVKRDGAGGKQPCPDRA